MTSETCSNSSFSPSRGYDVFLSLKEEDTGKSFADHLYNALIQKGIFAFRDDDQKLGSSELRLEAVIPVLYHVDPTQLIACFAEHQQVFEDNVEKVKKWKGALMEVINLSRSRHETDFIKEIVKDTWEKLNQTCPRGENELLVGKDSRVEKVVSLLATDSDDHRIIGIFGAKGIVESKKNGTDHLRKRLYKESFKIQGYVWNDGPGKNLLRRRLHSKRVLIVLDDVDSSKQIQDLVGNWKVENWLGRGSRVIVTSENEGSLNQFGKKYIYKVDKLTDDEALQVLGMRAFADNYILDGYKEVCNNVVEIADGNPLTLVNLGNFLRGRPLEEWSDKIALLKSKMKNVINTLCI
nr:disease resistance protein Roq1-like [Ziziphus jujuba var. spinosa]